MTDRRRASTRRLPPTVLLSFTVRFSPVVLLVPLLTVLALAGCGVPTEDEPRAVPPPRGPFPTVATGVTSPAGTSGGPTTPAGREETVLYFVRDNRLTPVVRRVDRTPTVDAQLRQLLAGPTAEERKQGLTSALPGAVTTAAVRHIGTRAEVEVPAVGDETGRSDGVLAFGQIVRTLAGRDDIHTVVFTRDGYPVGIPRADGSLSEQPLTAADYAGLTLPD